MKRFYLVLMLIGVFILACSGNKSEDLKKKTGNSKIEETIDEAKVKREIVPVKPSLALETYLDYPATHWELNSTIREFATDLNSGLLFGDEGLRMSVDPEAKGMVKGKWVGVKHRIIFDEICEANNLRWDVVDSNRILISPK